MDYSYEKFREVFGHIKIDQDKEMQKKIHTILYRCSDGLTTQQIVDCIRDGWGSDFDDDDLYEAVADSLNTLRGMNSNWLEPDEKPRVKLWMDGEGRHAHYPEDDSLIREIIA